MQALSEATNLSNWTLSLIVGAAAALKSGAQQGMEGELPFCDVLLALASFKANWRCADTSGENVFIGFDSPWARMMLKTFQTRRLQFVSLLLKDDDPRHPICSCHMVLDPSQNANMEPMKAGANTNFFLEESSGRDLFGFHYGLNTIQIRPNMFYGLVEEYKDPSSGNIYLVVHRTTCVLKQTIDKRATEFHPRALTRMLTGSVDNQDVKDKCKRLINIMAEEVNGCKDANGNDKNIIERIQDLLEFPQSKQQSVSLNEAMDRIHSRIPEMMERLHLKTFQMDGQNYTVKDVSRACVVYFGILRATYMSGVIYGIETNSSTSEPSNIQTDIADPNAHLVVNMEKNKEKRGMKGLVLMGYNINVGHELIRDIVEIPTLNGTGYSSAQVIENTEKERIILHKTEFSSVFTTSIFLDLALSVAIMLLSGIGPILSMYTARLVTAPYRESYLKMGTSMRWSIGDAVMFHSGTARDDWMVGFRPVRHPVMATLRFLAMAALSSIIPVILWCVPISPWNQFRIDNEGENHLVPDTPYGCMISILGFIVGLAWVFVSYLNRKTMTPQPNDDGPKPSTSPSHTPVPKSEYSESLNSSACTSESKKEHPKPWKPTASLIFHMIVNGFLTALPIAVVYGGVKDNWVYLYLLEGLYFLQWLVGEVFGLWVYESTALFMIGVVGAIRLNRID